MLNRDIDELSVLLYHILQLLLVDSINGEQTVLAGVFQINCDIFDQILAGTGSVDEKVSSLNLVVSQPVFPCNLDFFLRMDKTFIVAETGEFVLVKSVKKAVDIELRFRCVMFFFHSLSKFQS